MKGSCGAKYSWHYHIIIYIFCWYIMTKRCVYNGLFICIWTCSWYFVSFSYMFTYDHTFPLIFPYFPLYTPIALYATFFAYDICVYERVICFMRHGNTRGRLTTSLFWHYTVVVGLVTSPHNIHDPSRWCFARHTWL